MNNLPDEIITSYTFDPPVEGVSEMDVVEIDDGLYDLFDQDGGCWNEGAMFHFIPTKEEVVEFIQTRKIKGKME